MANQPDGSAKPFTFGSRDGVVLRPFQRLRLVGRASIWTQPVAAAPAPASPRQLRRAPEQYRSHHVFSCTVLPSDGLSGEGSRAGRGMVDAICRGALTLPAVAY
jgi:hypothetical protein